MIFTIITPGPVDPCNKNKNGMFTLSIISFQILKK